jgi:membrane-bound serine protease (ClpP class)
MSPSEFLGVGLVLLSLLFFVLEVKTPGLGALGAGGIITLVAGLYMLLGASPAALPLLVAAVLPILVVFGFLTVLAHRARRNKIVTGDAGMIGLEGRAETDLLPEGKVFVRGELWDAVSPERLERGRPVRVTGVRGLRLEVADADADPSVPSSRSVVRLEDGA